MNMPRPSTQVDRRLIKSGLKIFRKKGVSGLVLREIARDTGVNLGMFNYHFKGKDAFVKAVLKEFYEEFFISFESCLREAVKNPTETRNFEEALWKVGNYVLSNAETLSILAKDILNGEKRVLQFVHRHGHRHLGLMMNLIQECQKTGALRRDLPPKQILVMCAMSMGFTTALGFRLGSQFKGPAKVGIQKELLTTENLRWRLKILLGGLRP